MSKKPRGKSGSMSGPAKWEQGLLAAPLEEEGWRLSTALVVGWRYEDNAHIDMLIHGVKSGARRKFSFVQKDALYQEVLELMNPKNKKTKESPQHAEICETVKPFLDNGEELSLPLVARLIKFKLLYIKLLDQARIQNEKKLAAEKAKGVDPKSKGAKDKPKSAGKKGKGKAPEQQQPSAKQGSKLKKRGEEDEKTFIDDEPDDGPEHYVVIAGFNNPHLVVQLAEIGIHVDSIIKVSSDDYSRFEPKAQSLQPDAGVVKDEKTLAAEELARAKAQAAKKELSQFWQDVLLLLQQAPEGSRLHDVVRHETTVEGDVVPSNLEDDKDGNKKLEYGMAVFEKVACIMYDTIDLKRQHKTFLQNMKLLHVPVGSETRADATSAAPPQPTAAGGGKAAAAAAAAAATAAAAVGGEAAMSAMDMATIPSLGFASVDMRYYNDLMNAVPHESVSVPLMLYCMVEQVEATERAKEPPSEWVLPPRADGLDHGIASYVGSLVGKLSVFPEEQAKIDAAFSPQKPSPASAEHPTLIHPSDGIAARTGHLDAVYGFKAGDVERQMLKHLPFYGLVETLKEMAGRAKPPDRSARLQELLHFCVDTQVSAADVDHALKQFSFECLKLVSTDEHGHVEEHVLRHLSEATKQCVPWDYPYPFYKGMLPASSGSAAAAASSDDGAAGRRLLTADALLAAAAAVAPARGDGFDDDAQELEEVFGRSLSSASEGSRLSSATPDRRTNEIVAPTAPRAQQGASDRGSRPGTPGILRRGGSHRGSRSSVHFDGSSEAGQNSVKTSSDETRDGGRARVAEGTEPMSMEELVPACHQRTLDPWCYVELLEQDVLMQVIHEASYALPFMAVYHCKRDDSLLVVLHNPHDDRSLLRTSQWHDELHSNVGLRNYLEHVSDLVASFTVAEEAKYQASLQHGDVERFLDDEKQAALAAAKSAKRGRSKSPKSRKGSAQSKSPAPEDKVASYITDRFVKSGSLKAQQEEQRRLQAERDEEERLRAEKAAEKRAKSAKSKHASASEKTKQGTATKKDEEKKPVSRSSSKSRPSKHDDVAAEAPAAPKPPEKAWPFVGYDLGNKFVHAKGTASTLFPCDGSIIKTETVEFVQGSKFIKTSLIKDGHVFNVHVKDPVFASSDLKDDQFKEKADSEGSEKLRLSKDSINQLGLDGNDESNALKQPVGAFGSFSATFADGMSLSFSVFGASGVPKSYKKYEPAPYVAAAPRSPSPAAAAASDKKEQSPAKKTKDKGAKDKSGAAATPEPPQPQEEEPPKDSNQTEPQPEQHFNELYITCPDGLSVQYIPEGKLGVVPPLADQLQQQQPLQQQLAVRQAYPFKTLGKHRCEESRRRPAMEEIARVIRSDGTVIKTMQDGTTQVLYASGAVTAMSGLSAAGSWCGGVSGVAAAVGGGGSSARSESPYRTGSARSKGAGEQRDQSPGKAKGASQGKKDGKALASTDDAPAAASAADEQQEQKKFQFVTTLPTGERCFGKADGGQRGVGTLPKLNATVSVDPESQQILLTREDHVMVITMPNGTRIADHADGTRIIRFTKEFPRDDGAEGGNVVCNFVRVECPGYATVEFNTDTGQCVTHFGSETAICVVPDGTYCVYYRFAFIVQILRDGKTLYVPEPHSHLISKMVDGDTKCFLQYVSRCDDRAYVMNHASEVACLVMDPNENSFIVHHDGSYEVQKKDSTVSHSAASDSITFSPETQNDHTPRFFIVRSDGSGMELLRYREVVRVLLDEQPGVAVVREPVLNYPGVNSITVMKPYTRNISEQWLTRYSVDNLIPPGLRCRDLSTVPAKEAKKPGPKFGTTVGKGVAVGTAPRMPALPEPVICPSTLLLQRFVQYEPLNEAVRERLYAGLKARADFACQRDEARKELLPKDPRSFDERQAASDAVAAAASQGLISDARSVYERTLAPHIPQPQPKAKPKRTAADWERDRLEVADESAARDALRRHDVPPYFTSEMGKGYLTAKAQALHGKPMRKQAQKEDTVRKDHASVGLAKDSAAASRQMREAGTVQPDVRRGNVDATVQTAQWPVAAAHADASGHTNTGEPAGDAGGRLRAESNNKVLGAARPENPTPVHAAVVGGHVHGHRTSTDQHAVAVHQPLGAAAPATAAASATAAGAPAGPKTTVSDSEQPSAGSTGSNSLLEVAQLTSAADSNFTVTKSLAYDVAMQPRREPVHVPGYLTNSGKPNAHPNSLFAQVEEEHRRHVKTSSTAPPLIADGSGGNATSAKARQARGFELLPDFVDFGTVKEGCTYGCTVILRNVGVDTCRYKLCQPPPATGLRVIYTPGPIAAGMKADLHLELYAIAAGVEGGHGTGKIAHDLEVATEVDIMYLPIRAVVLTREEYERQARSPKGIDKGQRSVGVRYITDRPPNELGIVRPRKDLKIADNGSNAILSFAS